MMDKFTVEEINLMCVFDRQGRTELVEDIRRVMPHIKDSDMEELAEQVLEKLRDMSDEEFSEVVLEPVEEIL